MKVDVKIGEVSYQFWSVDELVCFICLVQDLVGYDVSCGDSVSVINVLFVLVQVEEIDSILFYLQLWFWDIVKQVFGVLFILVLVFGVLCLVLSNIIGGGKGKLLVGGGGCDGDLVLGESGLEGLLVDDWVSIGGLLSIFLLSFMEGYDV